MKCVAKGYAYNTRMLYLSKSSHSAYLLRKKQIDFQSVSGNKLWPTTGKAHCEQKKTSTDMT